MVGDPLSGRGQETRAAIMDAAYQLFVRHGFHGTSMRQIAMKAGVSLGAAYNHFASKQDIFRALLVEHSPYRSIVEALPAPQAESAAATLQGVMQDAIEILARNSDFFRLVFIDVQEFQAANVGAVAGEILPLMLGFFRQLVEQGVRTGEFRPVNPVVLMRALGGLTVSGVILEKLVRPLAPQSYVPDWGRETADILLHGVLQPGQTGSHSPAEPGREEDDEARPG